MTYPAVALREAHHVGQRYERGVMWDGSCGTSNLHVTRQALTAEEYEAKVWSSKPWPDATCDHCGVVAPPEERVPCNCGDQGCTTSNLKRFGGAPWLWNTPSGELEPGCFFWVKDGHGEGDPTRCWYWDNCDGTHLHVMLPNGHGWDVDSRANNCTMPDDKLHRCWVREGVPPAVNVSKAGLTCAAGAGSILSGDYHGFLQNGTLTAG